MPTSVSDGFQHPLGSGTLTKAAKDTRPYPTTPPPDGVDDGYYTAQGHGDRYDQNTYEKFHLGEDWNAYGRDDRTDWVLSISNGVVLQSDFVRGLGNYVLIRHDLPQMLRLAGELTDHVVSLYAHLNEPSNAGVGELVSKGEKIGEIGSSGGNYSPHLHFEIRISESYRDATGYSAVQYQKGWITQRPSSMVIGI